MKFIADTMLGTLAKWLRVLGFDTAYARGLDDDMIISLAAEEGRTIISRARELCARSEGSILIESTDLDSQIGQVLKLHRPEPGSILTRCLECNSAIRQIGKERAAGNVPPEVLGRHEEFRECEACGKIYWKGTHYRNMREKAEALLVQCES